MLNFPISYKIQPEIKIYRGMWFILLQRTLQYSKPGRWKMYFYHFVSKAAVLPCMWVVVFFSFFLFFYAQCWAVRLIRTFFSPYAWVAYLKGTSSLGLSLLVKDYSVGSGGEEGGVAVLSVREGGRGEKNEHKHMTIRRFESTLSGGEIKFGFLFNGRWPQLTKGDFPWLKKVTEKPRQLLLYAQNVIKHRSIAISGLLYHRMLAPSWRRVK